MEIAYHIGAHATDEGQLLKSLLRNADRLAEHGVAVPGPSRYRDILRETMTRFRGAAISSDSQLAVIEAIVEGDLPDRVVLSSENFISARNRAYGEGQLYPRAYKVEWMRNLFADHAVSFHIALRDPASLLPALWSGLGENRPPFQTFLGDVDPRTIRWSDTIARMQAAAPDAPIHVWCNEDSPLIWDGLMRDLAGLDPLAKLHGGFDRLRTIMSPEGMKRLRHYTKMHPPPNEITRRRIAAAFLDKFALADEIEEELDLPGWSADLVAEMSALYDEDMDLIRQMPNIVVVAP